MPRSRNPESYPLAYHEIVRACGLEGKTIRLPQLGPFPAAGGHSGLERLLKLRGHFYAFIGGLKKAAEKEEKWKELSNGAAQTVVYLDKEETALVFSNRGESWQAKAFEMAGEVGADAVPTAGQDASLAKVLAALAEETPGG